ncbi:MAG: glycoside hydrolase family 6 protein [Fibrobacterales bacterium]
MSVTMINSKRILNCIIVLMLIACSEEGPFIEHASYHSSVSNTNTLSSTIIEGESYSAVSDVPAHLDGSSATPIPIVSSDSEVSSSERLPMHSGVLSLESSNFSSVSENEHDSTSNSSLNESSDSPRGSTSDTDGYSSPVSSSTIDLCTDGIKNGKERGIDCGIDCGNCSADSWDFYLGNNRDAVREYELLLDDGNQEDANHISKIAFTPMAQWFGDWHTIESVAQSMDRTLDKAEKVGKPALVVVYAIYGRDCGGYSGGGMESPEAYLEWVTALTKGFEGRTPWVVLEPDGLAMLDEEECDQGDRAELLAGAAQILTEAGGRVYIDAANSGWKTAEERIDLISKVGTEYLHGFSTNVANTIVTEYEKKAAEIIAESTGLHYIIDTGRNGNGSNGEWCNPEGRALGAYPQILNDGSLDAYVWIKGAGWSDGECRGAPLAGDWFPEYALGIAERSLL